MRTQAIRSISCLVGCVVCAQLSAAEPVTLEAIGKKWQERQDKVKSAKVVWSEERTDTKGSLSSMQPPSKYKSPVRQPSPQTDVTYTTPVTASFQGDSLSFGYTDQSWSPERNALKRSPRLCVFDGRLSKTLYSAGSGLSKSYPDGHIQQKPTHPDVRLPQLRPVLMCFRPKHPQYRAYDIEQFTIVGGTGLIGGRPCVELQRRTSAQRGEFVIRCWVDPKRDYVIVREMMIEDDHIEVQIDIDYDTHPVAGWQPVTWKIITNHAPGQGGKMRNVTKVTLVSCDINTPISPKEFDIVFPKGTIVVDFPTREWYIVKPNGGKRTLTKEEKGKPYEELVGDMLDDTSSSRAAGKRSAVTITVLSVGVAGALLLGWRYYRRRGSVVS